MDPLTISLAALGGVVLAGVVAHGAWAARRAAPKQAELDVQRAEQREPVMDALDAQASDAADAAAEDSADGADAPLGRLSERRIGQLHRPRLDALIDAVVPLAFDGAVTGESLMAHLPPTRRAGAKPFLIEGFNAESSAWEPIAAGQRYTELQAGVLLANRSGALNEIEYSEFVQKIQDFAEPIGAMADFPDMLDVVARARELDAFASQHDAQLALRLRAREVAWSVAYVVQHVGHHGFVPGVVPGRMVLPAAEAGLPPQLTLTFDSQAALADDPNRSAIGELTLHFDVPQTDASAGTFALWQASANAIALELDAVIVDDNGRPLPAESFAAIDGELQQLYVALQARDLAAGSAAARRLFA